MFIAKLSFSFYYVYNSFRRCLTEKSCTSLDCWPLLSPVASLAWVSRKQFQEIFKTEMQFICDHFTSFSTQNLIDPFSALFLNIMI